MEERANGVWYVLSRRQEVEQIAKEMRAYGIGISIKGCGLAILLILVVVYHGPLSSWIAYGAVLGLLCYVVAMIRYGRLLRQWARTLPTLTLDKVEDLVRRMRIMTFCGIFDFPWGLIKGRRLLALARRKQASRSNT